MILTLNQPHAGSPAIGEPDVKMFFFARTCGQLHSIFTDLDFWALPAPSPCAVITANKGILTDTESQLYTVLSQISSIQVDVFIML